MAKPPARISIDTLVDLACRDGVEIRPTLLRVLTDLYVQKPIHGADEETQYVELALGLIDAVDAQTRSAVAVILSAYPNAPAAVLRKLAAARAPSSGERNGYQPAAHETAQPVRSELIDLFFTADAEERRLILRNLDVAAEPSVRRSLPVAGELLRRLENAALSRNTGEFARVLERALGVSADLAERITRDDTGEPVVVALKAIGTHPDVLARILLFLNPVVGQSAQRIYELAKLHEEISMASAERMLAIWRTSLPPRRADLVRRIRAIIGLETATSRAAASPHGEERRAVPPPHGEERRASGASRTMRPSSSDHAASRTSPSSGHAARAAAASPGHAAVRRPSSSDHAASKTVPALPDPASAPPGRESDSSGDDPGYWWDERQDVRLSSMLAASLSVDRAGPAAHDRVAPAASTAPAERAIPVHPSAYAAGQARAHAAAGVRTHYLTHDTVYWNDEPPGARAASTPAPSHAPAEREAPERRKSGERQ